MPTFDVPAPGAVVTVVTEHQDNYLRATNPRRQNVYSKVPVLDPLKWLKPTQFCVPNTEYPQAGVRVIEIGNVVQLVIHSGQAASINNTGDKVIKVEGSRGSIYAVTMKDGVATSCTCPGYTFRKQCKHLQIATNE